MTAPIVVIGDALLDVRVAPASPLVRGGDVPATIALAPGGQGANVAVRLARRGIGVRLVAPLANDLVGTIVRDALEAEGVELAPVAADVTGAAVVLGENEGERTMLSDRIPFADRIDVPLLAGAGWLLVSGYLLTEPAAGEMATLLAAHGMRRVILGCAVPDSAVAAWRTAATTLRADLWILNRDELRHLGPHTGGVAVTDANGAAASIGGVRVESRTPIGAPARDTTGAGDAFAAALVAGLRAAAWPPSREQLQDAVEEAVSLASRVARVSGAQTPVPGERRAGVAP